LTPKKAVSRNRLTTPAFCKVCGQPLPIPRSAKRIYCDKHQDVPYKVWRQMHRASERKRAKDYKDKNREKIRAANRRWHETHREERRVYYARRREDPQYRLHYNVGRSIRSALNGNKNGRSWEGLVGYSLADLKVHIEAQFITGMTWENYGSTWHIDHIRPISDFNFSSPEDHDFKACWSLWNLRPLWAKANRRKGDRCDKPPLPLMGGN